MNEKRDPASIENLTCPIPDCPVVVSTRNTLGLGKDLSLAVRKLRREMNRCLRCPKQEECTFRDHIEQVALRAIADVLLWWKRAD
jgi:hypothetical protein